MRSNTNKKYNWIEIKYNVNFYFDKSNIWANSQNILI